MCKQLGVAAGAIRVLFLSRESVRDFITKIIA